MKPSILAVSLYLLAVSSLTTGFTLQACHQVKCKASYYPSAASESTASETIATFSERFDRDPRAKEFSCGEDDLSRQGSAARRMILMNSIWATTASLTSTFLISFTAGVDNAFADGDTFEDLSMPTDAEMKSQQPKNEEDAMVARIRLKAELKKKAAEPKTFMDSIKGEQQKQKDMNKRSKEEQRAALCEELGRGC